MAWGRQSEREKPTSAFTLTRNTRIWQVLEVGAWEADDTVHGAAVLAVLCGLQCRCELPERHSAVMPSDCHILDCRVEAG